MAIVPDPNHTQAPAEKVPMKDDGTQDVQCGNIRTARRYYPEPETDNQKPSLRYNKNIESCSFHCEEILITLTTTCRRCNRKIKIEDFCKICSIDAHNPHLFLCSECDEDTCDICAEKLIPPPICPRCGGCGGGYDTYCKYCDVNENLLCSECQTEDIKNEIVLFCRDCVLVFEDVKTKYTNYLGDEYKMFFCPTCGKKLVKEKHGRVMDIQEKEAQLRFEFEDECFDELLFQSANSDKTR